MARCDGFTGSVGSLVACRRDLLAGRRLEGDLPGTAEASPQDPSAWRTKDFDDSVWTTGKGPFYYDDQPGSATAYSGNTQLTDMRGNYSSIYLRKEFVVGNPSDIRELRLVSFSDDGFIAWINGAEVARFNMPGGDIPHDGVALGALQEPVPVQTTVLGPAGLAPG